jgi:hypothetical protein
MQPQLLHWSLRFSYVGHKVRVSQDRYFLKGHKTISACSVCAQNSFHKSNIQQFRMVQAVEGLYCKRPIQCLASSELLTHPLTAQRVFTPPPPGNGAGGGHTRWVGGGGGGSIVRKPPDTSTVSVGILKSRYVTK